MKIQEAKRAGSKATARINLEGIMLSKKSHIYAYMKTQLTDTYNRLVVARKGG